MFNILRQNRTISPSQEFLNFAGEYSNKFLVKEIVKQKVPDLKVANVLQKCNRFEDFNIELLPDIFVIKVSHWCGDAKVVTKEEFKRNYEQFKTYYNSLLTKQYNPRDEPHYKYIKPILFIEEYLGSLLDCKFHCIHGTPTLITLQKYDHKNNSLYDNVRFSVHDIQWNQLNFTRSGQQLYKMNMKKPMNWEKHLESIRKLAKNIDYVRVDMFFNEHDELFFGEYTFTPGGCQSPHFTNPRIDHILLDIYTKKQTDLKIFNQFLLEN